MFFRHLGALELASASLATMFANVTGFTLVSGLSSALETLCSQAITGASDKKVAGIILQRGIILNTIMVIPLTSLWIFSEDILLALGQSKFLYYLTMY